MKPIDVGIGISYTGDAEAAAKDAQEMAGRHAELGIVFASSSYDPNKIIAGTS